MAQKKGTNPPAPAGKKPSPPPNPPSKSAKVEARKEGAKGLKTVAEMTDKELIDAYGMAKLKEALNKKTANVLKEVLKARTGGKEGDFEGAMFKLAARSKARHALSKELVEKHMDPETFAECFVDTEYMEYRAVPTDKAKAALMAEEENEQDNE